MDTPNAIYPLALPPLRRMMPPTTREAMVRPTTIVALILVLLGAALQYERLRSASGTTAAAMPETPTDSLVRPKQPERATSRASEADEIVQPATVKTKRLLNATHRLPLSQTAEPPAASDTLSANTAAAEPIVSEPDARAALAEVGVDAEAEQVWATAINDPNLSPDDRSNLIEDLNETGFADPQHPSADELPMIERRLELIETLGPDAMDATNAAAFQEAYKDLTNMYDSLQPR